MDRRRAGSDQQYGTAKTAGVVNRDSPPPEKIAQTFSYSPEMSRFV
jgi:hypothetical protein